MSDLEGRLTAMTIKRKILVAAVILILNCMPASGYALTATVSSNPVDATITGRGVECARLDLTPFVFTTGLPNQEYNPLFAAAASNVTGHGAITAILENRDGVKVAFVNQPFDEEIPSVAVIELGVSGFNPKLEGVYEEGSNTIFSHLRYFVSPGSFSTGTLVFTIRGIVNGAEILMFESAQPRFSCSGAGMVEIRLPFSLIYQ